MDTVKKKSLSEKRAEQERLPEVEQSLTELEIRDIEKDQQLTDLEIAVLELQEKGE
jgi:hypothetical protein